MEERACDAVVIDSYPALVPSDEDEKIMMELTVGRGAYFTNKFMRKSYAAMARSLSEYDRPVLALFVNQWRERIGVFMGDPRTTPGGKGKNYSFLTRVEVAREEWLTTSAKVKVGQAIKARAIKNKTAPPQRVASVDFYFDDSKDARRKGRMTPSSKSMPWPWRRTSRTARCLVQLRGQQVAGREASAH